MTESTAEQLGQRAAGMKFDLRGRLRNTSVPLQHGYLPLFEAVVNSIHSIEDRFGSAAAAKGQVEVHIHRTPQGQLPHVSGRPPLDPLSRIEVRDNGEGFTDANLEAFRTANTTAKASRGGKGVGRFTWLVVFERARIESIYRIGEIVRRRAFSFAPSEDGIENLEEGVVDGSSDLYTSVTLDGVQRRFVDALRKGPEVVAERLFEHCFNYFLLSKCPKIVVHDHLADGITRVGVNDHLADVSDDGSRDLVVNDHELQVRSIRRKYSAGLKHEAHLCAHNRVVTSFALSHVSKLSGPLSDPESGERFVQHLFVSGQALDESVDASRTRLDLPDGEPLLAEAGALDLKVLREQLGAQIDSAWASVFAAEQEEHFSKVSTHVRTQQPEYRHLLERMPDQMRDIKWNDDLTELDQRLYRVQQEFEAQVRRNQAAVERKLEGQTDDPDKLAEELTKVIEEVNEVGQSSLVRYVAKRRAVLRLISRLMSSDEGPAIEDHLHRIVFPLRKTGDQVAFDEHNLWLVDDTLSFYEFIASDIRFDSNDASPVDSARRPDLLAFKTGDPFHHVALVEFKRPERKDENPIQQLVDYAVLLRNGGAKDARGRTLPGIGKNVRIDGYAIATLTPELLARVRVGPGNMDRVDDWRWYGGVPAENLSLELLDYRAFVSRAEQRNKPFFSKLGLV